MLGCRRSRQGEEGTTSPLHGAAHSQVPSPEVALLLEQRLLT